MIELDIDIKQLLNQIEMPERFKAFLQTIENALLKLLVNFNVVLEIGLFDLLIQLFEHFDVPLVLLDQILFKFQDLELVLCDGHLGSPSDLIHIHRLQRRYAAE